MPDSTLIELLQLSLKLERWAFMFYRKLSNLAEDKEFRKFWKQMFNQEKEHVKYWMNLLDLAEKDKMRNMFDNPAQVKEELCKIEKKINYLLQHPGDLSDNAKALFVAYRIEFYMMHPAFEAMFHLMRAQTGDRSPEDNYADHIDGLIMAFRKFSTVSPEMELIAELMKRLWDSNQQLAVQLADIKRLQGLIPICMHCKNIRNDEGYWGKVEKYIEEHSDAQFSHGICPVCLKKYYSEYMDEET